MYSMIDLLKYKNGAFTFLIKIKGREREREVGDFVSIKIFFCISYFLIFVLPMYLHFFNNTKRCKFALSNVNFSLGHFDIYYIRIVRSRERTLKANNRTTFVFWPTM